MKTKFFLAILILNVIIFSSIVSASYNADVAYVLKNPAFPNSEFISSIENLNYTYDLIDDSDVSSTNFSKYKMILLGDEKISNVPVNSHKSLILDKNYCSGWGLDCKSYQVGRLLSLYNADMQSPLTQNLDLFFQVYNSLDVPIYYAYNSNTNPFSEKVITLGNSFSDLKKFVVATKSNPDRVFFGIIGTDYWTAETKTLFENSLKFLVGEENLPPVLEQEIPDIEWQEGESIEINLNDYFSDPESQELNFAIYNTSENSEITLTFKEGGLVNFSSIPDWNGTDWIIFSASDGVSTTISNIVNLIVLKNQTPEQNLTQNQSPIITDPSALKIIDENSLLQFLIITQDSDSENLTLTATNLPQGASFIDYQNKTGEFSWIPNENQSGIYYTTFTATDETNLQTSQVVTIIVNDINEAPEENQTQTEFSDVDLCEQISDSIKITIKEPGKNDEFKVGEIIEGEIKIQNNADEDLDFDVEFYLYDLDDDEEIENFDDSLEVDEGDSENLEFELQVPDDANEKNDFALLVKVSDKDFCNYKYQSIEIEREKYDVIISDFKISSNVFSGENVNAEVEVKNLGSKDQDVYIEILSSALGISEKTEEFELEKFDDDDLATKIFNLKIPEYSEYGEYLITATVFFNDDEKQNSKTQTILISEDSYEIIGEEYFSSTGNLITLNTPSKPAPITTSTTKIIPQKTISTSKYVLAFRELTQDEILFIIDIFLIVGICFEIFLILGIHRRRNRFYRRRH